MEQRKLWRRLALAAVAGVGVAVWVFPVLWGLLTSFKTERDVLAYPPVFFFTPTLANYREVLFGASSILPNLVSSLIVSSLATMLTMLFAIPAAYSLARLRYPAKRATLEGHADERGTRDYNLALGERRANAAKNYLASLGVDSSRIQTVSYGKERPQALGSNEESWAQNRRAVTVVVR